jgi:hypothetical protein
MAVSLAGRRICVDVLGADLGASLGSGVAAGIGVGLAVGRFVGGRFEVGRVTADRGGVTFLGTGFGCCVGFRVVGCCACDP